MRILKGYSKEEQKDLECIKNIISCNDLLHNITSYQSNTECGSIKDKYDVADTEERIPIIKDILDFYTGDAKFPDKKYVVHDSATDQCIYYNWAWTERGLDWGQLEKEIPEIKTKDEWLAINPAYEPMLESVEDDE